MLLLLPPETYLFTDNHLIFLSNVNCARTANTQVAAATITARTEEQGATQQQMQIAKIT